MMYKILIAEDEKPLGEKMTKNIDWAAHGYAVLLASDGEEALEILRTKPIDILVTDIRMPGMDGLELTERAKSMNENLKVIVISGHAEFELAQTSIRLGVEDYLLKPFRSERLFEVVQKAKEKIEVERLRLERESLQEMLAKEGLEKRFSRVFGWLADPNFFVSQSEAMIRSKFGQILKTGSQTELMAEIATLQETMDEFQADPDRVFVILNEIVVATLTAVKDLGFEVEQGVQLISNRLPTAPGAEFAALKEWMASFLVDINDLVKSRQGGTMEQLINKIKATVDEQYRSGITLNTLASRLNMSASQLSKLFFEYVGENFSDYVNRLKEQKAKELLKGTDKRVYEIADYLGFSDAYYFSSWFKRATGQSPTEYRDGLSKMSREREKILKHKEKY